MINIYSPLDIDLDYLLTHDEEHEQFYAKINALPESVQNVLFSTDTESAMEKVATQFKFDREQVMALTRLVRDIAITDTYFGDLVSGLQSRLNLTDEKAKSVAAFLISQIFSPALEDIKKVHKEKFGKNENMPEMPKDAPPPVANLNNVLDLRNKN